MAFYTSRVDDDGNELERRSLASSMTDSTTRLYFSSRNWDPAASVRYINSAAYIEKDGGTERSLDADRKNVYSECSSVYEIESDIVPPLDLQSEDDNPTTRDYTFSYRKHCEADKTVLKPDKAYEGWLYDKRKLLSNEVVKSKTAEQQKRQELENNNKRLADEKFQESSKSKAHRAKPHLEQQSSMQQLDLNQTLKSTCTNIDMLERPAHSQMSEDEIKTRLVEWEKSKRLQEERLQVMKHQEEQKRQELEKQQRRRTPDGLWEKWSSEAAKKAKPVPMNRGIFTLRGTTANIYVNSKEWQSIIPAKEED